jgi:hypothetical protein
MGGMAQAVNASLIRVAVVSVTTANTSIACADGNGNNIGAQDTIIACIEQTQTNYNSNNRTTTTTVYAEGYIRCSDDTSNDTLIVFWMAQESAADQQASPSYGFALVNGAGANSSIAVADKDGIDINADDALIAVIEKTAVTGAVVNRTANSSIYADGYIRCTDATDGDQLIVIWSSRTGARAHSSVCIRFTLATMGLSDESDITVTDIAVEDEILMALALDETSALPLDEVAAEATITAADTIRIDQVSPTVTAGAEIWIFWLDKSA